MSILVGIKGLELYYYTKVETMRYILKDANIYATNLQYMNDSEEYANGLKELGEIINKSQNRELITKQQLFDELKREATSYSISFSAARDLLSQWSMYAGESGVSIKMRFNGNEKYQAFVVDDKITDKKSEKREYLTNQPIRPQKVYYCTKEAMTLQEYEKVKEEVWGTIKNTTSKQMLNDVQNMVFIWKEMAPYVKRAEFRAEAEYRLVFDWTQLLHRFRIDYRNDKNVLKPYLDIKCEGGWPIWEIIVGPGFNQDVVYKSILHFLNHQELSLPKLSGAQYLERCEEYLESCGKMPKKVEEIWCQKHQYIEKVDEKMRYNEFQNIRAEMLRSMRKNVRFRNQLEKKDLTKDGIILSKSRIPYVF